MNEKLASEKIDNGQKITIANMRDKVSDNGKRGLVFQQVFTDTKYSGKEPPTCFIDDLRIDTFRENAGIKFF